MDGKIEMDDTRVGVREFVSVEAENKVVIGFRHRIGDLRFWHAKNARMPTLAQYIQENISEDVGVLVTNEGSACPEAMRRTGMAERHKKIGHKGGVYALGHVYTNTLESAFSLPNRGTMGTWHKISAKHLGQSTAESI